MAKEVHRGNIAVIGGGITGLTAAYRLQKAGFEVVLFEAGDALGGQISSARRDGFLLEGGPHTLLERGRLADLIAELGLQGRVVEANPAAKKRFVVRDHLPHALPTSLGAFLNSPILSPLAKLRLLAEPFVAKGPGERDNSESLADFITRRLGPEVLEFAVDPMVAGTFAGDSTKLSARHAFPKLFELEQTHGSLVGAGLARVANRLRCLLKPGQSRDEATPKKATRLINFDAGSQVLIDRLSGEIGKAPRLNCKVRTLEKKENGRWLIRFEEKDADAKIKDRQKTVDAVFCALPANALADISVRLHNADPAAPFEPLRGIEYAAVSVVSLGFRREDIEHPLDGFGMLVPRQEQRHILGTLFMSTLFAGRAPDGEVLLTTFVGGARNPEYAHLPSDEIYARTLADLDDLLGVRGEPTLREHRFWGEAIPQYNVGYDAFETTLNTIEATHAGLFVGGSFRDGIAVPDRIGAGYDIAERIETYLDKATQAPS